MKYIRIEPSTSKRCASPIDKDEKIEYLIRGELDRDHSTLIKCDAIIFIKEKEKKEADHPINYPLLLLFFQEN